MTLELFIPAHNALEIIEVLAEVIAAFALDPDVLSDPRTFKAHCALTALQRAFQPLEPIIRMEVDYLDADAGRLF